MRLFERILVPMSVENFPKKALRRAAALAKVTGAKVELLYVIEEQTLEAIDIASEYALAAQDRDMVMAEAVEAQRMEARNIVIDEAIKILADKGVRASRVIRRGVFTKEIIEEACKMKTDLVLMEYWPDSLLQYRIFFRSKIPIWVERGKSMKTVLAVLTNISPNKRVPAMAGVIARAFKSKVHLLYVIDPKDRDARMSSSAAKKEAKRLFGEFARKNPGVKTTTTVRTGKLDRVLKRATREFDSGTIIMGRFKKTMKLLGVARRDIKDHLCRRAPCNIVLVKPLVRM